MKPRVFVSSTFYDLKYIREDLANFIRAHDFEPIMFEDGDIGYTPGNPLDESCYETMRNSDMVILVVGGNYGSRATGEDNFKDYISVTRKEFKTAVDHNIPIFTFVDSKVLVEYNNYEINIDTLKENPNAIKFRNTKDVKVFEFISEIYSLKHISVTDFNQIQDIKDFLSKQWADMFKNYLSGLKTKKEIEQLENSVKKMDQVINSMNIMIEGISKKIFNTEDSNITYESLMLQRDKIKINSFCKDLIVSTKIHVLEKDDNRKILENLLTCLTYIYKEHIKNVDKLDDMNENEEIEYFEKIWNELDNKASTYNLYIDDFNLSYDYNVVNDYLEILTKYSDEIIDILIKKNNFENIFEYRLSGNEEDN